MKTKVIFLILALFVSAGIYGQDKKISELPGATTPPDSADKFVVVQSGTTKQIDFWDISQTSFPVDVRTNGAGLTIFESFWMGEDAGLNHTAGAIWNYGIGTSAHRALTSGTGNTAFGMGSGYNLTTGSGNHFAGVQSGYSADTSRFNVGIGYQSFYGSNGYGNISLGYKSNYIGLDGEKNFFGGWESGYSAGDADFNVGLGANSLYALTTGDYNVAIGNEALSYLTVGQYAVGIGAYAADSMSTSPIVAIGAFAGQSTTGAHNTIVGNNAALWLKAGVRNSVFGYNAMTGAWGSDGDDNAIFGAYAGNNLGASADQNTHLGAYAGDGQTTGSGTVKIGYKAGENDNTSNTLWIDNSNDATPLIYGIFDDDSLVINGDLYVTGDLVASDIDLSTSTLTGTQAEFNTAMSDGDFLATGSTTLSEPTILTTGDGSEYFRVQSPYTAGTASAQLNVDVGSIELSGYPTTDYTGTTYSRIRTTKSESRVHFNDASDEKSIVVDATNMTVTDAADSKGLYYAADYSSGATDRWIPDKAYVDNVGLSGALTAPAKITGTDVNNISFEFVSTPGTSGRLWYQPVVDGFMLSSYDGDDFTGDSSNIYTSDADAAFLAYESGSKVGVEIINGALTITDNVNGKGAYYADDYSSVGTARWLPDKEYADLHLGGQDLNATVYSPGPDDHQAVITYDSTGYATSTDQYILTDVVAVAHAAGMIVEVMDTLLFSNTSQTVICDDLPVGAVIHDIYVYVATTFNGGGTDLLDIGITADGNRYQDDLDIAVASGFPTMSLSNIRDRMAETTDITFQYFDGDSDASAGMAFIYVQYSIQ